MNESIYVDYSVKKDSDFITAMEFFYSYNEIEVENDALGINDEALEYSYLSWKPGMTFYKPAQYNCITC